MYSFSRYVWLALPCYYEYGIMIDNIIIHNVQVSLYICSADLSLSYQGRSYFINPVNTSGEIPGMINEITYLVNQSLFDAKYNNVKINIGNALQEVLVAINITLSKT